MRQSCSDEEFVRIFNQTGSPTKTAKVLGIQIRSVCRRRAVLERKGYNFAGDKQAKENRGVPPMVYIEANKARIRANIKTGIVIIGSDAHYWPGKITTAQRAFIKFIRDLKPSYVVMNGDAFDGARISRHSKIGFLEKAPTVKEELRAAQERLTEIEDAAKGAKLIWELGNHDLRFESYLAANATEMEGVEGMHLKDHFKKWLPCWGLHINSDEPSHTVIKHRFHGGIYDVRNNILKGMVSMVTGHTHSLKFWPMSSYRSQTIYGVNSGMLADPYGDQFVHYTEDNPVDWRSGFAVLTFHNGRLLMPELAEVIGDGEIVFRGAVHEV